MGTTKGTELKPDKEYDQKSRNSSRLPSYMMEPNCFLNEDRQSMSRWLFGPKKSSISFFPNKAPEGKYDSNLLSLFFGGARLKQKFIHSKGPSNAHIILKSGKPYLGAMMFQTAFEKLQ
jgi:hypothetical protein